MLFSETTEVRDGVQFISQRCATKDLSQKLAFQMKWNDEYLERGGASTSSNPSPGNKAGGLSNIMEKSMGAIAKSGSAAITGVLAPGERVSSSDVLKSGALKSDALTKGLIFAATPGSDLICGSLQLAAGISVQVFMTGRGTPYGLAAVPVIKVSSRTEMKDFWNDIIDINAGTIAEGKETIQQAGEGIFKMIIDTASGRYTPYSEKYRLFNDFCIFDPTPAT